MRLRHTQVVDLGFVVAAEQEAENRAFILRWTSDRHAESLRSADIAHRIIEVGDPARPVGFVLLAGLDDPHRSIELRRIVVTEKRRGYGRAALRELKRLAFVSPIRRMAGHGGYGAWNFRSIVRRIRADPRRARTGSGPRGVPGTGPSKGSAFAASGCRRGNRSLAALSRRSGMGSQAGTARQVRASGRVVPRCGRSPIHRP